eukprot:TRINITY_DN4112_c1_g2_i1.p1 TRINITY_DN4112_c1_g2~~TRINITY_DN4112_c1_g2_i1.p1  ORF type:complete len:305 (+),score=92.34 TRINITY_DN4112_c1_g2_i1:247-1161(+)
MNFSVASWNILADLWSYQMRLLGRDDVEGDVSTEALHWDNRGKCVVEIIDSLDSDILCLQEVEKFNFEGTLDPFMTSKGFKGLLQKDFSFIGCATFYREDKFELVSFNSRSRATIAVLKTKEEDPKYLAIGNVHFSSDHNNKVDDRFNQMRSLIQEIQKDLRKINKLGKASVLICGDFNCVETGGIHKVAYEGKLEKGYEDGEGVYNPKAAYEHPFLFKNAHKDANLPFTFKGRINLRMPPIDFVLYTFNSLDVTGTKQVVDQDQLDFIRDEFTIQRLLTSIPSCSKMLTKMPIFRSLSREESI